MEVRTESTDELVGTIASILIHPDTGKVEGFFVAIPRFLHSELQFLSSVDILRFGTCIRVYDFESVCSLEDHIRLAPLAEERRTILGQKIQTETGRKIGTCADVQFSTKTMMCEWLFPKRWWRFLPPVPLGEVVEVRIDSIVIRDPVVPVKEAEANQVGVFSVPEITEARIKDPSCMKEENIC